MKKVEVQTILENTLNKIKILDIHTHLFPPQHENYYLSGLVETLNYHYLIAELFVTTNIDIHKFKSLDKLQKAEIVWNELFNKRTPISEACKGVLTILESLSIPIKDKNFLQINELYAGLKLTDKEIFNKSNIDSIVMTNNPFDEDEWSIFSSEAWDKKRYRSSLRLDSLMLEFNKSISIAQNFSNESSNKFIQIIDYLELCFQKSQPIYAAISLDKEKFREILNSDLWKEILKWLLKKNLPLSLMLGVKRGVNKNFDEAGDGIGNIDLKDLSKLCNNYPKNKFLVTCLSLNDQHELTVLGRKHQNLKIFGFWWFMNQPSIIEPVLKMRMDLLGLSFIPQHSDARITDQLIYKWSHFKEILSSVMIENYEHLIKKNYPLSKEIINRDLNNLLINNAKTFLGIK